MCQTSRNGGFERQVQGRLHNVSSLNAVNEQLLARLLVLPIVGGVPSSSFKWVPAEQHGKQNNATGPDISCPAGISRMAHISQDLRGCSNQNPLTHKTEDLLPSPLRYNISANNSMMDRTIPLDHSIEADVHGHPQAAPDMRPSPLQCSSNTGKNQRAQ